MSAVATSTSHKVDSSFTAAAATRAEVVDRVRRHAVALASARVDWSGTLDPDIAAHAVIAAVLRVGHALVSPPPPRRDGGVVGHANGRATGTALPGDDTILPLADRSYPPRTLRVRSLAEARGLAPMQAGPCAEWWSGAADAAVLLVRIEAGGTAAFPDDSLRACDGTATLSCDFARVDPGGALAPMPGEWVVCVDYGVVIGELPSGEGRAAWLEVSHWSAVHPPAHAPPVWLSASPKPLAPVLVSCVVAALADPARHGVVDVVGEVTAVSPVLPVKGVSFFFVEIAERVAGGTNLVTTIVFKDAPMHHRHRIEVRRRYVFTSLKKTTMFKDDPTMRCDLFKPSSKTTIVPLRPDDHMPPPPAPPPASSSSLLVPPSSRVATSVHASKRARVEEVPSTDDFAAPPQLPSVPQPPATETCRTVPVYTGTVTAVVHATGMLYELDGTVLLLCSHWQTASRARELRPGNRVRIYNAHALRGPVPDWPSALSGREKHVGVLGCCVRTTIDVVSYGPPEKRAVMANSSNPLLRTFSKQLTLARFVGFLPMYDAMAEKFGGTNATGGPGADVDGAHALTDALRRWMLYPQMAHQRNIYREFCDHDAGGCVISNAPSSAECVDLVLTSACSRVPKMIKLVSMASLALLGETVDVWGKEKSYRLVDDDSPGVLVGALIGTLTGGLEIVDRTSSIAASVGGVEPYHLGRVWLFLRYNLVSERVWCAPSAAGGGSSSVSIRASVQVHMSSAECRELGAAGSVAVVPDHSDVPRESAAQAPTAARGTRDVCVFVTDKTVTAASSDYFTVTAVAIYGADVEESSNGTMLVISDQLHTTERVTVLFVGGAARWYSTVHRQRLYVLRGATVATTTAGATVQVNITITGQSEVCAAVWRSDSEGASHESPVADWCRALCDGGGSTRDSRTDYRELFLDPVTGPRLSKLLSSLLLRTDVKCEPVRKVLAPTTRSTRQGGTIVSLRGVILRRTLNAESERPSLSLTLEDRSSADTTTVYIDVALYAVPLGLVPGAEVHFRGVERRLGQGGGVYYFCVLPCTEIFVLPTFARGGSSSSLPSRGCADFDSVPWRTLRHYSTDAGRADRAMARFWFTVTFIRKLSCSWRCTQCGDDAVVDGACGGGCDTSWHAFKTTAHVEIQDGTAEGDLTVTDPDALWTLLGATPGDVARLERACRAHGAAQFSQRFRTQDENGADDVLRGMASIGRRTARYLVVLACPSPPRDPAPSPRTVLRKQTTHAWSKVQLDARSIRAPSALEQARMLLRSLAVRHE